MKIFKKTFINNLNKPFFMKVQLNVYQNLLSEISGKNRSDVILLRIIVLKNNKLTKKKQNLFVGKLI